MRTLAVIPVPLLVVGCSALAQTSHFYDQQGRTTGRAEDRRGGDTTHFYDRQGRTVGRTSSRADARHAPADARAATAATRRSRSKGFSTTGAAPCPRASRFAP